MNKHTPKPWSLTADEFSHIVVDADGNEIHVGRNEANARLIAAAPDLLRLVEEAYWLLEDNIQTHGIKHEMTVAMAKATGEEQ